MSAMPDRTPQSAPTHRSRTSIEVSTVITHHPVASSPDDDPTGVRALLSALPEPGPMPDYLVGRINASLAAEQAQRAASPSGASVTPLLATKGRRPGRLLFAMAGAAAAVALVAVVGGSLFKTNPSPAMSDRAAAAITSGTREARGGALASANDKGTNDSASTPPLIQIRLSETRYTQADFIAQARTLHRAAPEPNRPMTAEAPGIGPVGTALGLTDCLSAVGASGAQMVRADFAFYDGVPAVIIVADTNGIPMAYVVGRECSRTNAAVLRPATPLP
jgi:hypothetical protein